MNVENGNYGSGKVQVGMVVWKPMKSGDQNKEIAKTIYEKAIWKLQ